LICFLSTDYRILAADYFFCLTDDWRLITDNFSNEPIPPPMGGLDVARISRIIAQGPAQLLDARGQRIITHHRLTPRPLKELLFRHHLAGVHDQDTQHGQGFGGETHF
jgi:hypothetical protein